MGQGSALADTALNINDSMISGGYSDDVDANLTPRASDKKKRDKDKKKVSKKMKNVEGADELKEKLGANHQEGNMAADAQAQDRLKKAKQM